MCRVLIIDDEESICRMLLYALSRDYIDAEIATNGHDGLHKFNQEHFDIVITDISMPGMDGNSIAHQIRNSDKLHTPIIGISGTAWLGFYTMTCVINGELDKIPGVDFTVIGKRVFIQMAFRDVNNEYAALCFHSMGGIRAQID